MVTPVLPLIMPSLHQPQLINAVAHLAATLIFAIFLLLLVKDRTAARAGANWLSLAAAGLAFLWNLGSLAVLVIPPGLTVAIDVMVAVSFSALSLLPAVLLPPCLPDARRPALLFSGYLTSAVAVGLHVFELPRPGAALHQVALTAVTIGFALLTAVSVVRTLRDQGPSDRGRLA